MIEVTDVPLEATKQLSTLFRELVSAENEVLRARVRKENILIEIHDLQAHCPHENLRKDYVLDCAEMKLRYVCTDCGAHC